jgi:hypothetical protein
MSAPAPGPGRFVVPALVLAGLVAVVAVWLSRPEPRPEPEVGVAPRPARPPGIVASRPLGMSGGPATQVAELAIDGRSGSWALTGQLGSDEQRERAMRAATAGLGAAWKGEIVVGSGILEAPWLDGLDRALASIKGLRVRATLSGETVTVEGEASGPARTAALKGLAAAWGRRVLVVWQDPPDKG